MSPCQAEKEGKGEGTQPVPAESVHFYQESNSVPGSLIQLKMKTFIHISLFRTICMTLKEAWEFFDGCIAPLNQTGDTAARKKR